MALTVAMIESLAAMSLKRVFAWRMSLELAAAFSNDSRQERADDAAALRRL